MPLINLSQNQVFSNANSGQNNRVVQQTPNPVPTFAANSIHDPNNPIGSALKSNEVGVSQSLNVDPSRLNAKFNNTVKINTFFDYAIVNNASDIHFSVGFPPLLRVNGKLIKIPGSEIVSAEFSNNLFKELLGSEGFANLLKEREMDLSFNYKDGIRFRANIYSESGNIAAAFRLITSQIKNIEELYLPQILHELVKLPYGLILATGPTGSGKSTTLAAMINEINMSSANHIITVEDPIEYIYPTGLSLIDQREVGRDTKSWANALRSAMRQDPDVVLVGEMRDYETIASTITVAETGHLVFSTLHTNSASQALDRIIDVFPEHQQAQVRGQLANVLSAVISQRLIPIESGGRRVVIELLIGTSAVKNAIREGKIYQIDNMIFTGSSVGMIPLEKSIAELIRSGAISVDTGLSFTTRPDELKQIVGI